MSARDRQARAADRRKRGVVCVPLEVDYDTTDWLVDLKLLEAWSDRDPAAIGHALKDLVRLTREEWQESDLLDSEDTDSLDGE
jgi:hypothetical protein